jgi:hypothetical protein
MHKPRQGRTKHLLPFSELSPAQFERLCLWLVESEGFDRPQYVGEQGSDGGRDIVAYKASQSGGELWYFQCKRYKRITSFDLKSEVDKINRLSTRLPKKRPIGIIFVVSSPVPAATRDAISDYCDSQRYKHEFWAHAELDRRVKRHSDIVDEFFFRPENARDHTILTASAPDRFEALASVRSTPPQPYFNPPYHLLQGFRGRDSELAVLNSWYSSRSSALIVTGLGGIGKSALVWFWLNHHCVPGNRSLTMDSTSPNPQINILSGKIPAGVFWWSFYNPKNTVRRFLDELLSYVSSGRLSVTPGDVDFDILRALLSILQKTSFLIVLDGFEKMLQAYSNAIPSMIDQSSGGQTATLNHLMELFLVQFTAYKPLSRLILTTRVVPDCLLTVDGELVDGASRVDLGDLTETDAIAFFRAHEIAGTMEEYRTLFTQCGRHPLALRLVAGFIKSHISGTRKRLTNFLRGAHQLVIKDKGRQTSIVDISYARLDHLDAELLGRIAAFYGPVPLEELALFSPFESRGELDDSTRRLIELGLLQYDSRQSVFDLHPIIRHYAYARLTNPQEVHSLYADHYAATVASSSVDELNGRQKLVAFYYQLVMAGRHDKAVDLLFDRLWQPFYFELQDFELCFDLLTHLMDNQGIALSAGVPEGSHVVLYEALMLICDKLGELQKCARFAEEAARLSALMEPRGLGKKFNPDSRICFQLSYAGACYRCFGEAIRSNDTLLKAIERGEKARQYFMGRLDNPLASFLGGQFGDAAMEEVAVARARTELALLKAQAGDLEGATQALAQAKKELTMSVSISNYKEECIEAWRITAAKVALTADDADTAAALSNVSRDDFDVLEGSYYRQHESSQGATPRHLVVSRNAALAEIELCRHLKERSGISLAHSQTPIVALLDEARSQKLVLVEAELLTLQGKVMCHAQTWDDALRILQSAELLASRHQYNLLAVEAKAYNLLTMVRKLLSRGQIPESDSIDLRQQCEGLRNDAAQTRLSYTFPSPVTIADQLLEELGQ